tara:strand:- start:1272 stop:1433 length:162 start_codon:yes stop_codon:yes gene_type:complete
MGFGHLSWSALDISTLFPYTWSSVLAEGIHHGKKKKPKNTAERSNVVSAGLGN